MELCILVIVIPGNCDLLQTFSSSVKFGLVIYSCDLLFHCWFVQEFNIALSYLALFALNQRVWTAFILTWIIVTIELLKLCYLSVTICQLYPDAMSVTIIIQFSCFIAIHYDFHICILLICILMLYIRVTLICLVLDIVLLELYVHLFAIIDWKNVLVPPLLLHAVQVVMFR